jgi:lambda family phage tail tape measure protein
MMGIVDGTLSVKDAFKSMAAEIIKELYRVLVVQQMVAAAKTAFGGGLFGGASWSADGDVVGSSGIQAYANGGVVDSPTMFQHGGGLGVMGEAGPEAIMPLKRGANGKLGVQVEGGGGQNVVINQSFNFAANGDDSVKKLIAQAAPQIAQMTKSSLLNDRRRGGATKAAFG